MLLRLLPSLITIGAALALAAFGPIAQFPDYHDFADQRAVLGITHAFDVLSNAGFALVALWGMRHVFGGRSYGYALFVASLLLTAAGSAFYHLDPNDRRLVWDRLPIALACAGLLAAVHAESRGRRSDAVETLVLAIAAVASVYWWDISGDLRPYLLLQALPLVLIPLWQWIDGAARERRIAFAAAIAFYLLAKVAELNDHAVYAITGTVSGHTLKHLLATLASGVVVFELNGRAIFALYRDAMSLFDIERAAAARNITRSRWLDPSSRP
jgi:hypothetical protein